LFRADQSRKTDERRGEAIMASILLVEDNETNRDLLRRRLERRGYSVITAEDGEEGYSLANSRKPDLILLDISLPAMDGWQVAQLLKGNEQTRHIPIIVLTAHALISDRAKVSETGCSDYETKPVEFSRLTQKIDDLLPENRPA
jgi:two-component system cell cycle response regulator DivK